MTASFAVAPNFQCKGSWADRLLVAEGAGWRAPDAAELVSLTQTPEDAVASTACFPFRCICAAASGPCWTKKRPRAAATSSVFPTIWPQFLTFKDLSPPKDSVCELLVQDAGGKVTTSDVWALINFGEDPLLLAWPGLQLRLNPGEGFQTAAGSPPEVVPPANDELNALVAIRLVTAQDQDMTGEPTS